LLTFSSFWLLHVCSRRRLDAAVGAAGATRFAGVYAWPDRQVEVTAAANGLLINSADGQTEALPIDERTFLTDPADPDNPTVVSERSTPLAGRGCSTTCCGDFRVSTGERALVCLRSGCLSSGVEGLGST
jgi:hypothetical protein